MESITSKFINKGNLTVLVESVRLLRILFFSVFCSIIESHGFIHNQ